MRNIWLASMEVYAGSQQEAADAEGCGDAGRMHPAKDVRQAQDSECADKQEERADGGKYDYDQVSGHRVHQAFSPGVAICRIGVLRRAFQPPGVGKAFQCAGKHHRTQKPQNGCDDGPFKENKGAADDGEQDKDTDRVNGNQVEGDCPIGEVRPSQ